MLLSPDTKFIDAVDGIDVHAVPENRLLAALRIGLGARVFRQSRPEPASRYLLTVGNTREERYKQYMERYIRRQVDGDLCSMARSRSGPVASRVLSGLAKVYTQ